MCTGTFYACRKGCRSYFSGGGGVNESDHNSANDNESDEASESNCPLISRGTRWNRTRTRSIEEPHLRNSGQNAIDSSHHTNQT